MPNYPYTFQLPPLNVQDIPNDGVAGEFLGINGSGVLDWLPVASGGGDMLKSENLSGLANYATARTNIGLGTGNSPQFTGLQFSTDTFLIRGGAANLHLGAADAATPVAQTLSVQSVIAGTTNTAGAAFTIDGSQSTGTGKGGDIVFRTAPAGSSGTAQNALGTALTLTAPGYVVPKSWLLQNGFSYGLEMYGSDADALSRNVNNSRRAIFNGVYIVGNSGFSIGWSLNNGVGNDGANFAGADTILVRDGVGTLALRNGAATQTFNVYGTYTSGSVYERMFMRYNGTDLAFQVGAETLGATARPLQLWTGGASRLHITSAGNVGIGTTAPGAKLQVNTNTNGVNFATVFYNENNTQGGNAVGCAFINETGNASHYKAAIVHERTDTWARGKLHFLNSSNTAGVVALADARMTIEMAGNVGIGTTSPTSKLQVSAGDVEVDTIAKGVILKSPDGTRYRVTVANGGTLSVAAV